MARKVVGGIGAGRGPSGFQDVPLIVSGSSERPGL